MLSLSNGLSFLRAPLALLFLVDSIPWRITAIVLAMVTDSVDGYLARRYRSASQFGAILDPTMDKFFVFFGLGVLLMEGRLEIWQACSMLARRIARRPGRRPALVFGELIYWPVEVGPMSPGSAGRGSVPGR